jgi:DNA-binding MarR family transcriptional regulator
MVFLHSCGQIFYTSKKFATEIIPIRIKFLPYSTSFMADTKHSPFSATPPVDSPDRRRLPLLLRHAWYGLNQAFRRRILHTGVTPDQFTALRTLIESDPQGISQSELSRLMGSDPNTVASLLERMEAAGLLERHPHEKDRRAHRISLKPAGQRKYAEVREIAIGLQSHILSRLAADKQAEFLAHLEAIADACREAAESSPKRSQEGPKRS